jgi:hypothetical protein
VCLCVKNENVLIKREQYKILSGSNNKTDY